MGKVVVKETEGIKQYTVYSKKGFKNILALENVFPQYTFSFYEKAKIEEIYYDSKTNDLASAGIIISKNIEHNKGFIKIEREFVKQKGITLEKNKEEKMYVHPIVVKDKVTDHMFFIIDGILNMFSTKFHIDLENIIKVAVPTIIITNKQKRYKIYGGTGFKAEMYFEDISFKNMRSKRTGNTLMLTVKLLSSEKFLPHFDEFLKQLEKHVKELINLTETKHNIARKMTRPVTQADMEIAKQKKENAKKEKKGF